MNSMFHFVARFYICHVFTLGGGCSIGGCLVVFPIHFGCLLRLETPQSDDLVAKTLWWWAIGPLGAPIDHTADLVDFSKMSDLTRFFRIMLSARIAPENDLVAHYDAFGRSAEQIIDIFVQHKVTSS